MHTGIKPKFLNTICERGSILKSKIEIKFIGRASSVAMIAVFLAATTNLVKSTSALADDSNAANKTTQGADAEPVEARIKEFHDKLKISDAQEDLWSKVTAEMREHAKATQSLIGTRNQTASQMSAIDDLKSYADIAQRHADGMKQFLAVFSPLYAAMTDAQKKNADEVFRGHKDARAKKHQSALKKG